MCCDKRCSTTVKLVGDILVPGKREHLANGSQLDLYLTSKLNQNILRRVRHETTDINVIFQEECGKSE
jgi:phenylacetate-coenzyme A ligase PaaK-like adenylate-forming protein